MGIQAQTLLRCGSVRTAENDARCGMLMPQQQKSSYKQSLIQERSCTGLAAATLALQQVPAIAFMTVWIGGTGYGLVGMLASGRTGVTMAIPILMLAFGFFFLWRIADSLMAAWRMFYGITDRRLLVIEFGLKRRVTSWTPQQITSVERRDRAKGRGDVIFHQSQQPSTDGSSLVSAALVNVADVRKVEACVRRLANS